jgi:hypothetical protein
MQVEELFEVLKRINHEKGFPVDDDLLKRIIALVVLHPLDEDRSKCQDEIKELIEQHSGLKGHDH